LTDVTSIISDLERQRNAIDRAISALREVAGSNEKRRSAPARATSTRAANKKRELSPEGRQRIIEATKKRWAAKRAALKRQSPGAKANKKQPAKA
jgi:hypothetical protein